MIYPKSLEKLIESFKMLPGIGEKTAERLAFAVLDFDNENILEFSNNLLNIKENLKHCSICGTLTDEVVCNVCNDKTRFEDTIMVVEDSRDVFLFEKIGNFRGLYHVLGGLISPFNDIGPDDLNIKELLKRIENSEIKEVVLAIKSGIEADTTSLYIKKILEKNNIVVTRIASGIPIGADMNYVDALTLESALQNRKEVLTDWL